MIAYEHTWAELTTEGHCPECIGKTNDYFWKAYKSILLCTAQNSSGNKKVFGEWIWVCLPKAWGRELEIEFKENRYLIKVFSLLLSHHVNLFIMDAMKRAMQVHFCCFFFMSRWYLILPNSWVIDELWSCGELATCWGCSLPPSHESWIGSYDPELKNNWVWKIHELWFIIV